jgi:hypothetical protein
MKIKAAPTNHWRLNSSDVGNDPFFPARATSSDHDDARTRLLIIRMSCSSSDGEESRSGPLIPETISAGNLVCRFRLSRSSTSAVLPYRKIGNPVAAARSKP